jgi:hypothetical protein
MNPTTTTALTVHVDESRWIMIPRELAEHERAVWLDRAITTAERATAHWDPPTGDLIPQILEHALDVRGDHDGLLLQFWPDVVPGAVLVRVEVSEAADRNSVADQLRGEVLSRVEQFHSQGLGPGYEWLHSAPLPGEQDDVLIGTQYLFMDDALMVVVTLEATLPTIFSFVIEDVREFVASIELTDAGGPWRGLALSDDLGTRPDLETWPQSDATT